MKTIFWATTLSLLGLTFVSPVLAERKITMSSDQQEVLDLVQEMTGAFQEGAIEDVVAVYEPGAQIMFEPGVPISAEDQIRASFSEMAKLNPAFDYYNGHEVYVSGEIAIHFAPWKMTAKAPDGSDIHQSGLSVAVMRRQPDGSWRMIIDNPHGDRLLKQ